MYHKDYKARFEAINDITKYVELEYNQIRIQKGLDYKSPIQVAYAAAKGLRMKGLKQSLIETLALSAVVFFMLLGAEALGYFISVSRLSYTLVSWIGTLAVSPMIILICILIMYFLLGLFMDALAVLVITIPVVYPIILALGFDPVWFGIIAVLTVELGLIGIVDEVEYYLTPLII